MRSRTYWRDAEIPAKLALILLVGGAIVAALIPLKGNADPLGRWVAHSMHPNKSQINVYVQVQDIRDYAFCEIAQRGCDSTEVRLVFTRPFKINGVNEWNIIPVKDCP